MLQCSGWYLREASGGELHFLVSLLIFKILITHPLNKYTLRTFLRHQEITVFVHRELPSEGHRQKQITRSIKSRLTRKDPDAGKDGRPKEKGAAEDEVVRQYHRLSGCELGQTAGDSEGQERPACCSPWGLAESDTI